MIDKEKQYTAIYFPENMIQLKEDAYFALHDIDANFSKVIQLLLPQILVVATDIANKGKNYRHYEWILIVKERTDEKEKKKEAK